MWSSGTSNELLQKSFPIERWGKHFSSIGSKRAPLNGSSWANNREFSGFAVERKEMPTKEFDRSRWDNRLADLESKARITTGDTPQRLEERRLYEAMLANPQVYSEMRPVLSLRDINRYQFRRNRSSDSVPVEAAGQR